MEGKQLKDEMERFSFPEESRGFLQAAGERLFSGKEHEFAEAALYAYEESGYSDTHLMTHCRAIGEKLDLSPYTVHVLLLLAESQKAEKIYDRYDPTGNLYTDTFTDLAFKVRECMDVCGIIGIFPVGWYHLFFKGQIVRLGRLEYELTVMPKGLEGAGKPALSIHIPSGGGSFDKEARVASYVRAGAFFREHFGELFPSSVPAFCESWLLYPNYGGGFPKGSNLASFREEFDIQKAIPDPGFYDAWRIFGAYAGCAPSSLPENTALRSAMKDYLLHQGSTGLGLGVRSL